MSDVYLPFQTNNATPPEAASCVICLMTLCKVCWQVVKPFCVDLLLEASVALQNTQRPTTVSE